MIHVQYVSAFDPWKTLQIYKYEHGRCTWYSWNKINLSLKRLKTLSQYALHLTSPKYKIIYVSLVFLWGHLCDLPDLKISITNVSMTFKTFFLLQVNSRLVFFVFTVISLQQAFSCSTVLFHSISSGVWVCVFFFTVWAWPLWPPWLWWRPGRARTAALLAQLLPAPGHSSARSGWWKASSPPSAFLAWEFLKSWWMRDNEGHWFQIFTWCQALRRSGFTRSGLIDQRLTFVKNERGEKVEDTVLTVCFNV